MKGLVGGVFRAEASVREELTKSLVPRSIRGVAALSSSEEITSAQTTSWGQGDFRTAKKEMKDFRKEHDGVAALPNVRLPPLCASGPSGERQEHLDDIVKFAGASHRKRLFRAIETLTIRWAIGDLPETCKWLLNTQVMFLRKDREPQCKHFDDLEWLAPEPAEQEDDGATSELDDVLESAVTDAAPAEPADGVTDDSPVKVRPIQMGEFMRKYVSKRLLSINSSDLAKTLLEMRQLGAGAAGGAEALAIFHQLVFAAWKAGRLTKPLARIKVDEKNCFGSLEWDSVRNASREFHPKHAAVAAWKHSGRSYVEQEGVNPLPKDRGAEQGDVDGPSECALTLALVANEARSSVHQQQRRGELPWSCESQAEVTSAVNAFDGRAARVTQFRSSRSGSDPRHEVQAGGGLADFWYLDDGDVLCSPALVVPYLQAFDQANPTVGAERSCPKSEVIYYCTVDDLDNHSSEWRLEEVRQLAAVSTADQGSVTLGIATGPDECVLEQLRQKTRVVKAMHERVQVCADPQTELVLAGDSLGVSRVNHIMRVHGARLAESGEALNAFDTLGKDALDRLFPGLTVESHAQASLGARNGGLGWMWASVLALSANLGALSATKPLVKSMIASASLAGLCNAGSLGELLDHSWDSAVERYLSSLAEVEKVRAEDFLRRAQLAAEETWARDISGGGVAPLVPVVRLESSVHDGEADPGRNNRRWEDNTLPCPERARVAS
jgi:hypothetical protein